MTIIPSDIRKIREWAMLHIITMHSLTPEIITYLDEKILEIYSKWHDLDIKIAKIKILAYLQEKRDTTLEIWYIAEFFIHLYLNQIWYLQECLFKNLESGNDTKKGFDGYYSKDNEEWLMESKSGSILSKDISHKSKVQDAYTDLTQKVSGVSNNNPWENAYMHASLAKSNESIVKNIKKLSDNYTLKTYAKIDDFNIIPSSTIFLDWKVSTINTVECCDDVEKDIVSWISTKKYKNINVICITHETKDFFLKYLTA